MTGSAARTPTCGRLAKTARGAGYTGSYRVNFAPRSPRIRRIKRALAGGPNGSADPEKAASE